MAATARHIQSTPASRRNTLVIMIIASVIALACAFGPLWLVRAGVVVAVAGAAFAVWFAFREMGRMEALHLTELKAVRLQAREAASAHHGESMSMIDTFTERYKAHATQLAGARSELAAKQTELSTVRGNLVSVQAENQASAERITELEAQIAELQASLANQPEADVVSLPRRRSRMEKVPTAAELWAEGNPPTLVNLSAIKFPLRKEA